MRRKINNAVDFIKNLVIGLIQGVNAFLTGI